MFSVPTVDKAYSADGIAVDKSASDVLAAAFVKELLWCIEADTDPKHQSGE